MRLKKDSSEQKLRGAYYTPLQLADAMVELFASQNISTVLEPSCGDGVFLDALQNLNLLNKVDKLTAVEIEPDEAKKVRDRYSELEQIEVCTEDFFDFYNRVLGKDPVRFDFGQSSLCSLSISERKPARNAISNIDFAWYESE